MTQAAWLELSAIHPSVVPPLQGRRAGQPIWRGPGCRIRSARSATKVWPSTRLPKPAMMATPIVTATIWPARRRHHDVLVEHCDRNGHAAERAGLILERNLPLALRKSAQNPSKRTALDDPDNEQALDAKQHRGRIKHDQRNQNHERPKPGRQSATARGKHHGRHRLLGILNQRDHEKYRNIVGRLGQLAVADPFDNVAPRRRRRRRKHKAAAQPKATCTGAHTRRVNSKLECGSRAS